jgi:hypothetical protein
MWSSDQRIRIIWAGHVAGMVETRNTYKILIGTSEAKKSVMTLGEGGMIILKWK